MEQEIWKWVPNYEGFYKVSNLGNVLSFKRNIDGIAIKPTKTNNGYMIFNAYKDGEKKNINLHKVVCELFNDPSQYGFHQVTHIDCNKENNRADNLRWKGKIK